MIHTADTVLHRPTGVQYQVACVHGDILYTLGYPAVKLLVDACALIESASAKERNDVLLALAQSSSKRHRPECARQTIVDAAHVLAH